MNVSTDGTAGPYIIVPVEQLVEVRHVLDEHRISYSVEEEAISVNGSPEIAAVDLGLGTPAAKIQSILDSVR